MDATEDLSARVLLKHILTTETPRTPVTRSAARVHSASRTTRSKKDAGAQTPQNILRRSLKHKMRESITRKSLPATTRRRTNTPAPASLGFDEGETPRHILRNILLTEPVKTPIVHETAASEGPQLPPANSSITRKRPSTDLSGLDLPDLTIGNAVSTAKGLRRKRPRRSLNVTAFEKRLKDGDDNVVENENEESRVEHSSLSLSSSTSLNLKTPFVDVRTEKRGLQRRVSNRRKITEEEFGAAVNNRQVGGVSSFMPVEQGLSETAYSEGFTLGLSKLSEPDITTDIVNCNTALYAQSDAIASNLSIVATQDKPTVMASQLQRQIQELEDVEKSKLMKEKSMYKFLTEDIVEPQDGEWLFHLEEDVDAPEFQKEDRKSTADGVAISNSEEVAAETSIREDTPSSVEGEDRVEAQTEKELPQTEEDAVTSSQSGEEEVATDSQAREREDAVDSQTEQADGEVDFQPKESKDVPLSDSEEELAPNSQTEDEDTDKSPTAEGDAVDSDEVVEARSQSEEEGDVVGSQTEDEHDVRHEEEEGEHGSEQLENNLEHISRRAYRSEGGLIMAVTDSGGDLVDAPEAGWPDSKSKAHSAFDQHSSLEMGTPYSSQPHTGISDLAESSTQGQKDASYAAFKSDADKENSVNQLDVMHGTEDSSHPRDASPEEADEQEEIWEDEDDGEGDEEIPCKTPAFVKEKRNFVHTDHLASPSLLKNIKSSTSEAKPAAKPKQARKRRGGPAKKEPGLPKNYLMGVFKHFAKTKVSADVYPVLKEIMNTFFDRLAEDLETYAHHAKRSTIEFEDAVLLLKRQGYVNDKVPVEALIEKYLRMDQRRILIPIATSGNVVIPKKR
ncbi:centromere protein T isoform X2 [Anabas testudineus]|uniref:centromere protein T isoform X2 n=1 Tax=Anabas testudineus TaxID=64144 RepID=UPI000E465316|nr:centromere protein T isoform X2 [Anabas testudineus]